MNFIPDYFTAFCDSREGGRERERDFPLLEKRASSSLVPDLEKRASLGSRDRKLLPLGVKIGR